MNKDIRAVFTGSFDPLTNGHIEIALKAAKVFGKIYIAVGVNSSKQYMLPLQEKVETIKEVFNEIDNIDVVSFTGLTTDLCKSLGINHIVRGLRTTTDYEFEKAIALMNQKMMPELETVFFLSSEENMSISSTIIKEIYKNKGDVSEFIPKEILNLMLKTNPII